MSDTQQGSSMSTTGLDDKEDYHELTDKQKSIVNVKAKHPGYGPNELAEEASKQLEGDETVSRSYVGPILNKYGHIIEKRRETLDNDRYEGETKTVGDPFADKLNTDTDAWQGIKDRPAKIEQPTEQAESKADNFLTVRIWQDDLEKLLNGNVSEEFQKELINQLAQKAFE